MPVADTAEFEKTQRLTPDLLRYVENVVWGFQTGVRYRILERRNEFERVLLNGHFLILNRDHKRTGTVLCLLKRVATGRGTTVNALYETTLSVVPEAHGHGFAKQLVSEASASAGGTEMEYAYVEDQNIPSAAAFKSLGFSPIGQFHAMTFNRLRPRKSARVRRLANTEHSIIRKGLAELYRNHALADFEQSFEAEPYWVILKNGQIIAGAQIEEEVWSIVSMPGPDGWFAAKALPHIPILRQILNPARIPVLKIGNLFIPEGHENDWAELIEHLTLSFGKKLALMYLDKCSPVARRLMGRVRLGFFNAFFETPVNIWARYQGIGDEDRLAIQRGPFVISPLDIS